MYHESGNTKCDYSSKALNESLGTLHTISGQFHFTNCNPMAMNDNVNDIDNGA